MSDFMFFLIGDSNVGKTCLFNKLKNSSSSFSITQNSLGSANCTMSKIVENKKITVNLWDTAGQDTFATMVPLFTKNASLILMCYSITDDVSFQSLEQWKSITSDAESKYLLVGLKQDIENERKVSTNDGHNFASEVLNAEFIETSAKSGYGIHDLIDLIFTLILDSKPVPQNELIVKEKKEGGCCK